jgi:hypothetical protein
MYIHKSDDGKRWISPRWYDHTEEQLISVLTECGISETEAQARIKNAIDSKQEGNKR